jgi:hypothetical protein
MTMATTTLPTAAPAMTEAAQIGALREALALLLACAGHDYPCDAFRGPCDCALRRPVGVAVAALAASGGLPDWLVGYDHEGRDDV